MKRGIRRAAALLAALALLTPAVQAAEPEMAQPVPAEAAQTAPEEPAAEAASAEAPSDPAETADTAQDAPTETPPASGEPGQSAPAENAAPAEPDWRLLLVNPWNLLPEDFTVELKRIPGGLQADARIYDDLTAMLADCRAAGLRPLICSAYRPLATQTRLYNNKVARLLAAGWSRETAPREAGRWVAAPGTSEHQTGLALDIVASSYQLLNERQGETAEQKWLMEHCWEYGFILRYPADKTEITGIGYEPWHYRYVGRETALAIRDSGLCLEEYLETLKTPAAPAPEAPVPAETAEEPVNAAADMETLPESQASAETEEPSEEEPPAASAEKKPPTGRRLIVKPPKNP